MKDIERVCAFLENAGTYYLATAEGNQPRVRPFGTVLLYEGRLYIQTGKSKNVSKQLAANPKAELCAFKDGQWLRVSGELVNDDSPLIARAGDVSERFGIPSSAPENPHKSAIFQPCLITPTLKVVRSNRIGRTKKNHRFHLKPMVFLLFYGYLFLRGFEKINYNSTRPQNSSHFAMFQHDRREDGGILQSAAASGS